MHAQTQGLQLYHRTLTLLPSRVLTLSISCTCSVPLSLLPLLSLSVPLRLLSPLLSSLKICMQSDEIIQAYTCARRAHHPFAGFRIVHLHHSCTQTAFETQTYSPINNKCSIYRSEADGESQKGWVMGGETRRKTLCIVTWNWRFEFASESETKLQLWSDDPLYNDRRQKGNRLINRNCPLTGTSHWEISVFFLSLELQDSLSLLTHWSHSFT